MTMSLHMTAFFALTAGTTGPHLIKNAHSSPSGRLDARGPAQGALSACRARLARNGLWASLSSLQFRNSLLKLLNSSRKRLQGFPDRNLIEDLQNV